MRIPTPPEPRRPATPIRALPREFARPMQPPIPPLPPGPTTRRRRRLPRLLRATNIPIRARRSIRQAPCRMVLPARHLLPPRVPLTARPHRAVRLAVLPVRIRRRGVILPQAIRPQAPAPPIRILRPTIHSLTHPIPPVTRVILHRDRRPTRGPPYRQQLRPAPNDAIRIGDRVARAIIPPRRGSGVMNAGYQTPAAGGAGATYRAPLRGRKCRRRLQTGSRPRRLQWRERHEPAKRLLKA